MPVKVVLDGTGETWGREYWAIWLVTLAVTFLVPEIIALATGQASNTLSAFVWRALAITDHESWALWSATDFLVFGVWAVLVLWLTGHFFFGMFH